MKKPLFILSASALLIFSSCRKDHVCECTSIATAIDTSGTIFGSTAPIEVSKETIIIVINDSEKKAKEACEKGSTSSSSLFGVVTTKTTCELR